MSKLETNDIYSTYKQNLLTQMLSKQKNIYKKMHNCNSTDKIEYLLKYNNLNYNINKFKKKYKLQEGGMDTVEANEHLGFKGDQRDYGVGAQIIRDLGISKLKLITNNPKKRVGLIGYGLEIVENISIEVDPNVHNKKYLETKRDRMGHDILK